MFLQEPRLDKQDTGSREGPSPFLVFNCHHRCKSEKRVVDRLLSAIVPLNNTTSYCGAERIHICLFVVCKRNSLIFYNLQPLSPFIPALHFMVQLSTVETVRKMVFSTSTPMRPLHRASVTRQATGRPRRLWVSQTSLFVCLCLCILLFQRCLF